MFMFFLIIIMVIELPLVNLASFRFRRSDQEVSNPLRIGPPVTVHPDIIKKQKPILRGVGISSNKSYDVTGSLQSKQPLLRETVPGPTTDLLRKPTSKSGTADADLAQDKIIQNKFSAFEAPVSVSERKQTSQGILVNQENASQITTHNADEYRILTPRIFYSTMPHHITTERSMRSIYKTPSSRNITNQDMVSVNIWSHGESTIKSENKTFRDISSRNSAAQDVSSVSNSSKTRDMNKSQGRFSQNPSQGSSVKIIHSSKVPQHNARRTTDDVSASDELRLSHTLSTYPFYQDGHTPAPESTPSISYACDVGKCYEFNWKDPNEEKESDEKSDGKKKARQLRHPVEKLQKLPKMPKMQKMQKLQKFQKTQKLQKLQKLRTKETTTPTTTTTTEDDSIFPEQYI